MTEDSPAVLPYVERVAPPPAFWAGALAFGVALGVAFHAALGPLAGLLALVVPSGLAGAVLLTMSTEIRVEGGELRVGDAHIPVRDLGPARPLDAEESRAVRGPRSDPAAFHVIRGWIPCGVVAEVVDPADPTPYWFVASRAPDRLAEAIEAARSAD